MAKDADETHHITPSSRYGGDEPENLCEVPHRFHANFHYVFHNLKPAEQVQFVQDFNRFCRENEELDGADLYDLREAIRRGDSPQHEWSPK